MVFYDFYYTGLVALLQLAIMIWKLVMLWFPAGQFGIEVCVLGVYALLAFSRLKLGAAGNSKETHLEMTLFIILSILAAFCNYYFIDRQTYM